MCMCRYDSLPVGCPGTVRFTCVAAAISCDRKPFIIDLETCTQIASKPSGDRASLHFDDRAAEGSEGHTERKVPVRIIPRTTEQHTML